jgi:hypothetical protein
MFNMQRYSHLDSKAQVLKEYFTVKRMGMKGEGLVVPSYMFYIQHHKVLS